MAENLLALAVRPLDVATPLLQARRIQQMESESAKNNFELRQAEMGSEFRGLAPFVNSPEFGQRWGEAMDRMAQRGILDPQRHAQLRNSPSPLLLQQGLAMTSSGDQFLKLQQLERTRTADATLGPQLYGGSPQPTTPTTASPAVAAPSSDPAMTFAPREIAQANAPESAAPVSFNDRFSAATPAAPGARPVQTIPAQQDDAGRINTLRRIASNPDVSPSVRETATLELKALIDKQSKGDTPEAQAASRRRAVVANGGDPNDPQMKAFILSGRMPREDQQPLSAADKKAILEADEGVASAQSAVQALQRAKVLSKTALGFRGAGVVAEVGALGGSQTALDTIEMNNIISTNAISQLKAIFGGNPTEGERKILLEIQGSSQLPHAAREKIFDRAIEAANRRLKMNQQRSNELRGQTFYKPGGGLSQGGQQPASQPNIPPPPAGFEVQQ